MENQRSTTILKEFLADPKNRDLFGRFAERYHARIKRCCLGRGLQDADADDLASSILLRFCERDVFDGFVFQSKEKFYSWLDTVAHRAVLMFVRGRGRQPDAWSVGNPDAQESLRRATQDVTSDLQSIYAEARQRIDQASEKVKTRVEEKTWQAFQQVVEEEVSVAQVTNQLEMSKEAVWKAISRVKRMMREELRDLHDPDTPC